MISPFPPSQSILSRHSISTGSHKQTNMGGTRKVNTDRKPVSSLQRFVHTTKRDKTQPLLCFAGARTTHSKRVNTANIHTQHQRKKQKTQICIEHVARRQSKGKGEGHSCRGTHALRDTLTHSQSEGRVRFLRAPGTEWKEGPQHWYGQGNGRANEVGSLFCTGTCTVGIPVSKAQGGSDRKQRDTIRVCIRIQHQKIVLSCREKDSLHVTVYALSFNVPYAVSIKMRCRLSLSFSFWIWEAVVLITSCARQTTSNSLCNDVDHLPIGRATGFDSIPSNS
jgi:hypothetical protein